MTVKRWRIFFGARQNGHQRPAQPGAYTPRPARTQLHHFVPWPPCTCTASPPARSSCAFTVVRSARTCARQYDRSDATLRASPSGTRRRTRWPGRPSPPAPPSSVGHGAAPDATSRADRSRRRSLARSRAWRRATAAPRARPLPRRACSQRPGPPRRGFRTASEDAGSWMSAAAHEQAAIACRQPRRGGRGPARHLVHERSHLVGQRHIAGGDHDRGQPARQLAVPSSTHFCSDCASAPRTARAASASAAPTMKARSPSGLTSPTGIDGVTSSRRHPHWCPHRHARLVERAPHGLGQRHRAGRVPVHTQGVDRPTSPTSFIA